LQANAPDPVVSVDVEFVPLWQTDEYKDYYGLEHVALCDTVQVIYPPLNLDLKAKVVKTVYNVLADRYDEISISTVKQTLTDTIFTLMKER
jgi:phage minor structural protein